VHEPTDGTVVGVGVDVGVSEDVDETLVDEEISELELLDEDVLETLVVEEITLLELVVG
jgi:hypothetical protein